MIQNPHESIHGADRKRRVFDRFESSSPWLPKYGELVLFFKAQTNTGNKIRLDRFLQSPAS
jgi:hypothetical protein